MGGGGGGVGQAWKGIINMQIYIHICIVKCVHTHICIDTNMFKCIHFCLWFMSAFLAPGQGIPLEDHGRVQLMPLVLKSRETM